MNYHGAGIIDAVMLAALRSDIESITSDPQASTLCTVSTPVAAPTVDHASGTITRTTADDSPRGLLQVLTAQEIESSGGLYKLGDQMLRLLASDLSVKPTVDTTVTAGTARYNVVSVSEDVITGTHFLLTLRPRG